MSGKFEMKTFGKQFQELLSWMQMSAVKRCAVERKLFMKIERSVNEISKNEFRVNAILLK